MTLIYLLKAINYYWFHALYIRNKLPTLPSLTEVVTSGKSLKRAVRVAGFLADLTAIKVAVHSFSRDLKKLIDKVYEYGEQVIEPAEHLYNLEKIKPGLKRLHGPQQLYTGREELEEEGTEKGKGMSITFKKVSFVYPGKKDKALNNVSFHIEAGEVTCFR